MSASIATRYDQRRGCGWRQPGGTYLVAQGVSLQPCGLLPIHLTKCPTCSGGIKPCRSWTWVDVQALKGEASCQTESECCTCPLGGSIGKRQGLLWIGGAFYKKPSDWTAEAIKQGISRRLSAVPTDFKIGETWVLVAHREAIRVPCPDCVEDECDSCGGTRFVQDPGIFHAFKPTAIEYVVKGDETDEYLERLIKRGITPVKIVRVDENQQPLADDEDDDLPESVPDEPETGPQFEMAF